jgi:chemotaxis signal transduction protein
MSGEQQYCTFLLDGLYFGIDVLQVQEVIRHQEMTRCHWRRRTSVG